MGERVVQWSGLPKELLEMIGKSLDTRVDVLRFRSVCSSWRSSIPPSHAHSPRFPLKFPPPSIAIQLASISRPPVCLWESTLYLLQPVNLFPTSDSSCCNKGWVIKVEESNSGKLRLLDPLSHRYIGYFPLDYARTLNLMSFRIIELSKAYTLRDQIVIGPTSKNERNCVLSCPFVRGVKKAVMFPNSAWTSADECVVFVIFPGGKLAFAKFGDEEWTVVDDGIHDDVIVYKGQVYVVDRSGIVSQIEYPSSNLVQVSPPLHGLVSHKHLVESCGALYVVDRYSLNGRVCVPRKTVDIKVYKLDEKRGQWDSVKSLDDRAFVLGTGCSFSVSSQEFFGYKGNCIYFTDSRSKSCVFNLNDQSIGHLTFFTDHSHPFCPPPAWLSPTNPSSSTR